MVKWRDCYETSLRGRHQLVPLFHAAESINKGKDLYTQAITRPNSNWTLKNTRINFQHLFNRTLILPCLLTSLTSKMSFLFSPWIDFKRKRPLARFCTCIGHTELTVVWCCLSRRPCFCCVLMISFLGRKRRAEKKAHSQELLLLQLLRIDRQSHTTNKLHELWATEDA